MRALRLLAIAALPALVLLAVLASLQTFGPAELVREELWTSLTLSALGSSAVGTAVLALAGRLGGPRVPLLPGGALIFAVVSIALGLRAWLDIAALEETLALESDDIAVAAPELGPGAHRLIPNLRGARVVVASRPIDITEIDGFRLDRSVTRRKAFTVDTNALGMRGTRELQTPAEGFRAVFVGSSITFGHGVDAPHTFVRLLEERLGIEVINAGVPGRRSPTAARWLAELRDVLDPDLIVLSESTPGEPMAEEVRILREHYPGVPLALMLPPTPRAHDRLVRGAPPAARDPAAERLSEQLGGLPVLDLSAAFLSRMEPPGVYLLHDASGQALVDLETGAVIARSDSRDHVVAPELTAAMEADHSLRIPFFVDDAHPDEEGHALMAELIGDWLLAEGLVPAGPREGDGETARVP